MAIQHINKTIAVSDLSDAELTERDHREFVFSINGKWYQIDMTHDEKLQFDQAIKDYVNHARPYTPHDSKMRDVPVTTTAERVAIRQWYNENREERKLPVINVNGQIPDFIIELYDQAHGIKNRDIRQESAIILTVPVTTKQERDAIREWAITNHERLGLPNKRLNGKIPDYLLDIYDVEHAHGGPIIERERRPVETAGKRIPKALLT